MLGTVAILSGLGSVLAGYAAARWGSAAVLRLALAGASVCIALIAVPHSLAGLLLTTCSYGLFVGAIDATMNMQGVAIQDRYGRSIMVGFHGMWSLGAVIGGVYATISLELDWPLLPTLLVVSAVGLLLNGLLCRDLLAHEPIDGTTAARSEHATAHPVVAGAAARDPDVRDVVPRLGDLGVGRHLPDRRTLGVEERRGPRVHRLPGGPAADPPRRRRRRTPDRPGRNRPRERRRGVVAVALVVAAPSVPVTIAGFALLGAGLAMIPPLSMVAAGHLEPEGGGQALARVNVSNYVGYLVAALAIAVVAEQVSHRAMFVLPLLLSPVLLLMAGSSSRAQQHQSCVGNPRLIPPCDGSSQRLVIAFSRVKKSTPCGP